MRIATQMCSLFIAHYTLAIQLRLTELVPLFCDTFHNPRILLPSVGLHRSSRQFPEQFVAISRNFHPRCGLCHIRVDCRIDFFLLSTVQRISPFFDHLVFSPHFSLQLIISILQLRLHIQSCCMFFQFHRCSCSNCSDAERIILLFLPSYRRLLSNYLRLEWLGRSGVLGNSSLQLFYVQCLFGHTFFQPFVLCLLLHANFM